MKNAEKQDMINTSERIDQPVRRIRVPGHQVVQRQVRRGGDGQHGQHGGEDPEGFHLHLEGNEEEHEHNHTDSQYGDLAGRVIQFQAQNGFQAAFTSSPRLHTKTGRRFFSVTNF